MYHIVSSWSAMALEPSEPVAAPPVLRGTHYGTAGVARMTVRAREPRSHQRPPGSFFDQPVNSTQETRIHQIERGSNVESRAASQMDEPAGRTGQHACSAGTTRRAAPAPAVSHSMRDRLVRLAYRFLWSREDAEDVVQEALTIAHQRTGDLRDSSSRWAWVCRIVVNRCHEHGRQKLRRERHEGPVRLETQRRLDRQATADTADDREVLRRILGELPRRQYEVIVLRHLQGMSFEQIADVLEIAPATVRVHVRSGRETLRRLMLKHAPDWFERATAPSRRRP